MGDIGTNRITVIVGNYGSGKTEIALNLAYRAAEAGERITLVDLDIVNPYFRSADHRKALEAAGIDLLAPTFAGTNLDIPALPAEIASIFEPGRGRVILDVGGDDTGAAALGQYKPLFDREGADVWFVINACRPLTGTAEEILDLVARIESRGRLRVTGLINNTNLGDWSTVEDLAAGQRVAEAVAERLGLPLGVAGQKSILDALGDDVSGARIEIRRRTQLEWMIDP